eukprot:Rmarinus@m.19777
MRVKRLRASGAKRTKLRDQSFYNHVTIPADAASLDGRSVYSDEPAVCDPNYINSSESETATDVESEGDCLGVFVSSKHDEPDCIGEFVTQVELQINDQTSELSFPLPEPEKSEEPDREFKKEKVVENLARANVLSAASRNKSVAAIKPVHDVPKVLHLTLHALRFYRREGGSSRPYSGPVFAQIAVQGRTNASSSAPLAEKVETRATGEPDEGVVFGEEFGAGLADLPLEHDSFWDLETGDATASADALAGSLLSMSYDQPSSATSVLPHGSFASQQSASREKRSLFNRLFHRPDGGDSVSQEKKQKKKLKGRGAMKGRKSVFWEASWGEDFTIRLPPVSDTSASLMGILTFYEGRFRSRMCGRVRLSLGLFSTQKTHSIPMVQGDALPEWYEVELNHSHAMARVLLTVDVRAARPDVTAARGCMINVAGATAAFKQDYIPGGAERERESGPGSVLATKPSSLLRSSQCYGPSGRLVAGSVRAIQLHTETELEVLFAAFEVCDRNFDGTIDPMELRAVFSILNIPAMLTETLASSPESAEPMAFPEMLSLLHQVAPGFVIPQWLRAEDVYNLKIAFDICDANGDGLIGENELRAVLEQLLMRPPMSSELKRLTQFLDQNADGVVTWDEFVAFMFAQLYNDALPVHGFTLYNLASLSKKVTDGDKPEQESTKIFIDTFTLLEKWALDFLIAHAKKVKPYISPNAPTSHHDGDTPRHRSGNADSPRGSRGRRGGMEEANDEPSWMKELLNSARSAFSGSSPTTPRGIDDNARSAGRKTSRAMQDGEVSSAVVEEAGSGLGGAGDNDALPREDKDNDGHKGSSNNVASGYIRIDAAVTDTFTESPDDGGGRGQSSRSKREAAAHQLLDSTQRRRVNRAFNVCILKAALAGFVSTCVLATTELYATQALTLDGQSLFQLKQAVFWYWFVYIPVVGIATALEVLYVYRCTLSSAVVVAAWSGTALHPLDRRRAYLCAAIARVVLELGNSTEPTMGVDPLRRKSKLRIFLRSIAYKAKTSVTVFLARLSVKRVFVRAGLKGVLPFVGTPIVCAFNALVAWKCLSEAQSVIIGPRIAVAYFDGLLHGQTLTPMLRIQAYRAVSCAVVAKGEFHPALDVMLRHASYRLSKPPPSAVVDDKRVFVNSMAELNPEETRLVLQLLTLAIVADGSLSRREYELFQMVARASGRPNIEKDLREFDLVTDKYNRGDILTLPELRKLYPVNEEDRMDKAILGARHHIVRTLHRRVKYIVW